MSEGQVLLQGAVLLTGKMSAQGSAALHFINNKGAG